VQVAQAPPSSWHWNVEPDFVDVNWKLAEVDAVVAAGDEVIDVSGGVRSTVHEYDGGDDSVFETASVERTENVCDPVDRLLYVTGLVHEAKAPPSSEHSYVAAGSFALKVNVALLEFVSAAGPELIVEVGAVVSIVHWYATEALLPAASVPVTVKLWVASARFVNANEPVHETGCAASSTHVVVPSLVVNANEPLRALLVAGGFDVSVTTGATVSTFHVAVAADGSTLPAASFAWTVKVWLPWPRPS
jgi:hypothetical protein